MESSIESVERVYLGEEGGRGVSRMGYVLRYTCTYVRAWDWDW